MPNRATHLKIGAAVGAIATTASSANTHLDPGKMLAGIFGGMIGGALPDVLEPANDPRHRGVFHSVTMLVLISGLHRRIDQPTPHPNERRSAYLNKQISDANHWSEVWLQGVRAGYVSHLLLDACTPARLPVIAKGI